MTDLPRIETTDPDQALTICRSLLALIENIAREQKKCELEEAPRPNGTPTDAWHGIQMITLLVRNTLADFEFHAKEA